MSTWSGWLHIVPVLEALAQSRLTVVPDLVLTLSSPPLTWATNAHYLHPASCGVLHCPTTGSLRFTAVGGPDLSPSAEMSTDDDERPSAVFAEEDEHRETDNSCCWSAATRGEAALTWHAGPRQR